MLLQIGIGIFALLAVFLGYVAAKPSDYVISREIAIHAPPEKIFPYLDSAEAANDWMPWQEIDPKTKMEFTGPARGVGSRASWTSEGQMGVGSATVTEVEPLRRVALKLEYVRPFTMEQDAAYLVRNEGGTSIVTWQVAGKNTFLARLMCTFMNMDKMVGDSFEKGLAKLKRLAENGS
jgi:uncharacterized protein YndB with AHSA1/START domain